MLVFSVFLIMQPYRFEAGMADGCPVPCPGLNSRSLWGTARASHLQTCNSWSDKLTRVANSVSVASKLNDTWSSTATFVTRHISCLGGFGMGSPSDVINSNVHSLVVCTNNIPAPLRRRRNCYISYSESSLVCLHL